MTDPWTKVRARIRREYDVDDMSDQGLPDLRLLLTDADALLAVKDYVKGRRDGMPKGGAYVMIPVAELNEILAALPENLK